MKNRKNCTKKHAATSASTGGQEYVYRLAGNSELNGPVYLLCGALLMKPDSKIFMNCISSQET
jgi:hypothetical protein